VRNPSCAYYTLVNLLEPTVISQSSHSARSIRPARPAKVAS